MDFIRRHWRVAGSVAVLAAWIAFRVLGWPWTVLGFLAVVSWFGWLGWRAWIAPRFAKTRDYRFDGEQGNHATQARETAASIAQWAAVEADPDATPEQRHWLNRHRAGMEDRLAVFEATPRLTVEQMNERDAIETHLYGAPLPRGAARAGPAIRGFLGPIGAVAGGWQVWAAGGVAVLALVGWGGWEHNRAKRYEAEASEANAALFAARDHLAAANVLNAELRETVTEANQSAGTSARTWEAERARRLVAERELRRIRNAMDQARAGGPVDYGIGGVRDAGPVPAAPDSGASAGPGGPG